MKEITLVDALAGRLNPHPPKLTASDLLRIIARGVEIGHTGSMRDLKRGDLMTLARDYCDANGLSYARTDLRVVERAGFLRAGDSR